MDGTTPPEMARRDWLSPLARAPHDHLIALGTPFNLGEMTVTRAALTLESGEVGHGYVQGRSKEAAGAAALVDALMQTEAAGRMRAGILAPLAAERAARRQARAARAAATKVEFFTLVRGEDCCRRLRFRAASPIRRTMRPMPSAPR